MAATTGPLFFIRAINMKKRLGILAVHALTALSVSKLETELVTNAYPFETLAEALALEIGKEDPRKTAIEALEDALCDALRTAILRVDANATFDVGVSSDSLMAQLEGVEETISELAELAKAEKLEAEPAGYTVPKGKAMTTLAGIKGEGQEITAKMVVGGEARLALLKSKGLLV